MKLFLDVLSPGQAIMREMPKILPVVLVALVVVVVVVAVLARRKKKK